MWILGPFIALLAASPEAPPADLPQQAWFEEHCFDPHSTSRPLNAWQLSQVNGDIYALSRTRTLDVEGLYVCTDHTIRTSDGVDIRTPAPPPDKPWRPGCLLKAVDGASMEQREAAALEWITCSKP